MSVIGFDIGNESCVIAAAKRGGVDVLLNDESKRETPAVVSFGEKQRFLGSAGAAFATANPKSTISQIKRLIGKLYKEVEEDLKMLPFTTIEGPRGGILIELEYLKTKWMFTPVEILGMLFKHLKQITEKSLESSVFDCVIGIPSYYTDLQRRMYLNAAHIAGLNPLRLIHDGTAIALGYGMYKTDLSKSKQTIVMFVDIGHCDTQVTVAGFEQGGVKILSHSFDQNLGGRDFDEVLFKHFSSQFNEKHKIDVYANTRASVRLMASCEKVKKVLSANAEAPLSIECLIGDTDVRGIITRDEFENLSSKLLERVIVCCNRALKDSGLSSDKLCTIELVGSGSRIPAITRFLISFFEKEPKRTLNASECVARGCALYCAMLSPNLLVREYKVEDFFPYSIVIPSPQGEIMIFPKGSQFPNQKPLHHSRKIPFYLQVAYGNEKVFPAGISHIVGHFGIGSSERFDAEEAKVKFIVKLNHHGIVEIDSAKILEDKLYSGGILFPNPFKTLTPENRIKNLSVSENLDVAITNDELVKAKEKDRILTEQDIKVEEIKDQRNTLESFVYDTRTKLSGVYKSFAKDLDKEVITNKLQETEDWLYEDSDDESEQDYTGRLKDLKKLLEPIENRYNEEHAVAKAIKALQSCIAKYHLIVDSLQADKKDKVKMQCIEAEQWVNIFSQKHSSPKIVSTDIYHAIEIFESNCESIIRSKSSFPRHKKPVDPDQRNQTAEPDKKAIAKPLLDCTENYYLLAESLPADQKQKVQNECNKVHLWLNDRFQKHSSPINLSADINRAIEIVESKCEEIIKSQPSFPRREEPVNSDQRGQTMPSGQKDQRVDSENVKTEAKKALDACIANHRSHAESLPADLKDKVKKECTEAEQRVNNFSQTHSSPKIVSTEIYRVIKILERKCQSIIRTKSSFPRHEKPVDPDQRNQTAVPDEIAMAETAKPLVDCIANYYLLAAESLPADQKDKVEYVCNEAQRWLNDNFRKHSSPNNLSTEVNRIIEYVERDCKSIMWPQSSVSRHEEPVDSRKQGQTVDSENARIEATKALKACIAKHRSHAQSLPADMKDKVNNVCFEAQQLFITALSGNQLAPNTLKNYVNRFLIKEIESQCKSITGSEHSFQWHEEQRDQPMGSAQRDQPMDMDQVDQSVDSDQRDQPMDTDQVDQSVDSDQRGPHNGSQVHKWYLHSELEMEAEKKTKGDTYNVIASDVHICHVSLPSTPDGRTFDSSTMSIFIG